MVLGDTVLAIASNGLHTNGYSLVRLLMDKIPRIKLDKIDGLTFIEQIMKPHTPYYKALKDLLDKDVLHGMAHITGGGIEGNLCGVGIGLVVPEKDKAIVMNHINPFYKCYEIGKIEKGKKKIVFEKRMNWL